jgi:hypothetical protein
MKKLMIFFTAVFLSFEGTGSVFAESPFFAKTVFIAQITSTQQGYKIVYLDDRGQPETVYLPIQWFYKETGATSDGFVKAEIIYGRGPQFPYMQIYFKKGVFDHLLIFADADYSNPSWGVLPDNIDISSNFHPDSPPDFKFDN